MLVRGYGCGECAGKFPQSEQRRMTRMKVKAVERAV